MKNKIQYPIRIYWSDEDDAFIAEVPALRGCVSHGDTVEEAAINIQEAMEAWLAAAKKIGKTIPQPDITMARIAELGPLLNYAELSRRTKIKRTTLVSKIHRGTPFTKEERKAILEVI